MIWHIFKKDWKLVWPFVLIVSAVHWIGAAIVYKLGEDPMLGLLAEQLPALALFASMFLIGAIVHVDATPGARQDWLVTGSSLPKSSGSRNSLWMGRSFLLRA